MSMDLEDAGEPDVRELAKFWIKADRKNEVRKAARQQARMDVAAEETTKAIRDWNSTHPVPSGHNMAFDQAQTAQDYVGMMAAARNAEEMHAARTMQAVSVSRVRKTWLPALAALAMPGANMAHSSTATLLPTSTAPSRWYRSATMYGMRWHEPPPTVVSAACGDAGYAKAAKELGQRLENTSSKAVSLVLLYSSDEDLANLRAKGPVNGTRVTVQFVKANAASLDPDMGWQEAERFKCCNLKLHLPALLPRADGVAIWVDLDTRLFGDVAVLHRWFRQEQKQAGAKAWAALAWESADSYDVNWYRLSRARRPLEYYEPNGLNSGVIVADLAAWRSSQPQLSIEWGYDMPDQDALNVYFQQHRDELLQLPFEWNWRGARITGGVPAEKALIEHFAGCGIGRDPASCPDHER